MQQLTSNSVSFGIPARVPVYPTFGVDCCSRTLALLKVIPLTQGQFALVDDEDFEWLNQWKWYADRRSNTYYAKRLKCFNGGSQIIKMHRQILSVPKGKLTDHRDGNGLNNTRANLRACTKAQNTRNRRPQKNCSSRYKGVYWNKRARKWLVRIEFKHVRKYLGLYVNEIEAAKAYDRAANNLHGEYAHTNF